MKYVEITVKSAKMVVDSTKKSQLHHFDLTTYNTGAESSLTTENDPDKFYNTDRPVLLSPISNMLHVFLGARPAPRNRMSLHNRLEHIDHIAKMVL